ncbi:MAG: ATP synthase F1 subunit epsilon [Akkermansiaceae bacterium]|nr:ATP synthase F1 subunit epsilon [Akkermansiaceae bacterium]
MIHLVIVTREKTYFSDSVEEVYLPGESGELGVLAMHTALMTTLVAGELRYSKDGEVVRVAVGSGFADVTQHKVTVLTDMAVGEHEIDEEAVKKAKERAERALAGIDVNGDHDTDQIARLEVALKQSIAKLKVKNRKYF